MGATHPDEEQVPMTQEFQNMPEVVKDEPAIGVPTEAVQDSIVVINTVEPTVMHFWPACLSTFFCHIFGLACTLLYFNSKHGKAGAATGIAVQTLKMLLFSIMAAIVVSHYHTPQHFNPDSLNTPEKCEAMHGEWNPYVAEHATRHHHRHHHHHRDQEQETTTNAHPCSCPKWYLEMNNSDGTRTCIDSKHFWIKVSVISALMFVACMLIRHHYLKDAVTIRQVAVIAQPQPGYTPAPTQGIVINDL